MNELWQPVPGWEGLYEASDQGRIKSLDRPVRCMGGKFRTYPGSVLKTVSDKDGYQAVTLSKENRRTSRSVHRLVLETFVGPRPEGTECCHLNGLRGDNRRQNLKWDTHTNNCADKVEHGTAQRGEMNPASKLTEADVREIKQLLKQGMTQKIIALKFDVTKEAISLIHCGKNWKHVA